jgi:lantibiotic biosynthesis protein
MEYNFFSSLMLRTPVFSAGDYEKTSDEEMLANLFFRAAIFSANAIFYTQLQKKNFDAQKLGQTEVDTLRRYYNRACFRPTPFGLFSAVSCVQWATDPPAIELPGTELELFFSIDFSIVSGYVENKIRALLYPLAGYIVNSSIYEVNEEYRYIKYERKHTESKRIFSIASVTKFKVLKNILDYCHRGRTLEEMCGFLENTTGLPAGEVEGFCEMLIREQLVLADFEPGITGAGWLETLLLRLRQENREDDELKQLAVLLDELKKISPQHPGQVVAIESKLVQLFGLDAGAQNIFYSISVRNPGIAALSTKYQPVIQSAMACLDKLVPAHENRQLEAFKKKIVERFERKEIPLLKILDPEIGLSYENLGNAVFNEKLSNGISFPVKENGFAQQEITWTKVHSLLLDKWHRQSRFSTTLPVIDIDDADLGELGAGNATGGYPPSLSVIFRLMGDKVYLEQVAGVTGTAVLARFGSCSKAVASLVKEVADMEQSYNKDIVFAEVAHICDEHVANINRREHVRDYEIPVLVNSSLPYNRQVLLSDLYLSVKEDTIILRSAKLNAVVIPRLSSAFNYVRNELPVFRFLCDLQYQGLKTDFKLSLPFFFPGLNFYPRVTYKDSILHLATWLLTARQVQSLTTAPAATQYAVFLQLAGGIGLPALFTLSRHDNHIVFDSNKEKDVLFFIRSVKNRPEVVLVEFPGMEGPAAVTGNDKKRFINQFVAPVYLTRPVYQPAAIQKNKDRKSIRRNFLPGSEWLYFKFYCHPVSSNEILVLELLPVLEKMLKRKMISHWFFVRYSDAGYHIRLRLHVAKQEVAAVIDIFRQKFNTRYDSGLINKFTIETYEREIERYSASLIEIMERCFYRSSVFVARFIMMQFRDAGTESMNIPFILFSFELLFDALGYHAPERQAFTESLSNSFFEEFGGGQALKRELENKYASFKKELQLMYARPAEMRAAMPEEGGFLLSLEEFAQAIAGKEKVQSKQLVADMLHMHLNRIFVEDSRKQELVCYYMMARFYKSLLYRNV